jgi:hypothetical protein
LRRFKKLTLTVIMALLVSTFVASPALADHPDTPFDCATGNQGPTSTTGIFTARFINEKDLINAGYEVYASTSCSGDALIPRMIKTIAERAFQASPELTGVKFVESGALRYIGPNAFFQHPSLREITMSRNITSISDSAFAYADKLTSVTFLGNAPTIVRDVSSSALAFRGTGANSTAYISATATGFGDGPTWEGLTIVREGVAQATAPSAPSAPSAPYSGPLPTNYSDRNPSIGGEVTISGPRLNLVTSCTIDGVSVSISNQSADSFTIIVPEGLAPGLKDLVMTGSFGKMTAQGAFTVEAKSTELPLDTAKTNSGTFNGYVAVYARGYKGKTLSWKIAGKWFTTAITSDYQIFQRRTVAVGLDVNVHLYLNGEKESTRTVTTR